MSTRSAARLTRPILLVAVWLLAAQPGIAQQSTSTPVTMVDDSGVATTFAQPPRRILSLNPGLTETVFALGAADRLVGVDSFSDYPPEAQQIQPRLETFPSLSIETVVNLNPDLVLTLTSGPEELDQLRGRGLQVLKLLPRDYETTATEIAMLGNVLGVPDRGQSLAQTMRERRDATLQAIGDAPRPRLFMELDASDPSRPFAAGPNGFYGQLVDLAGATNVFSDLPRDFGQVSAESVIERDPELIILTDAYLPFNPQTPAMVAARPGWDRVTAVRQGGVYAIQGDLVSRPSPRLADGLDTLAYLIHPDRFASSGGPRLASSFGVQPFCAPGETATFSFGFGLLAEALGARMGEPTECAHVDALTGDTYQQTSKGLAIYRRAENTPTFVSGTERWAYNADGLVEVEEPSAAAQP
jgi:iron complex transport system substrate-binding protein